MNTRALLDADMRTMGQWLLQGWRWWLNEMNALIPPRFRRDKARAWPLLAYSDGALLHMAVAGSRFGNAPKAGLRATVVIPCTLCLSRMVKRPVLNDRDLQRMATLEAEALLPLPLGSVVIAVRSTTSPQALGAFIVEIAGLPVDRAREVSDAILAAGVVAERIVVEGTQDDRAQLDFAPAIRDAGMLPRNRNATPLVWALVGVLVSLNLAAVIWRDMAQIQHLENLVQEQQPAVSIAQTIMRRSERDRSLIARSVALRDGHNALGALEMVGNALPNGVWLQRYVWDGPTVRLVGYRPPKTDAAGALRKSRRFSDVRTLADETQATVTAGEPFDITARIAAK